MVHSARARGCTCHALRYRHAMLRIIIERVLFVMHLTCGSDMSNSQVHIFNCAILERNTIFRLILHLYPLRGRVSVWRTPYPCGVTRHSLTVTLTVTLLGVTRESRHVSRVSPSLTSHSLDALPLGLANSNQRERKRSTRVRYPPRDREGDRATACVRELRLGTDVGSALKGTRLFSPRHC